MERFSLCNANRYKTSLSKMIVSLRDELAEKNVPFIAGELGPFQQGNERFAYATSINRTLNRLTTSVPGYGCVSAEGLTDNGDGWHFDAMSLRQFGRRYADTYMALSSDSD